MTATMNVWDLFSPEPVGYSPATLELTQRAVSVVSLSATDWRPLARGSLKVIEQECGVDGWDGPGSKRVFASTITAARLVVEQLYMLLPKSLAGPDIVAEADGEIDFSWYNREGLSVSFSVSPRSTITYAANFGKKGVEHGWKTLDEAVETVVRLVVRLFKTEAGRGRA